MRMLRSMKTITKSVFDIQNIGLIFLNHEYSKLKIIFLKSEKRTKILALDPHRSMQNNIETNFLTILTIISIKFLSKSKTRNPFFVGCLPSV